ncbi:hypothetical protein F5X98DRAFT_367177 [Xylaria grammica]|nr:hypothetical protein F5X98DRAFT_367177 [Xylaria grammica]
MFASFEYLQWQELYQRQKPYEVFFPLSTLGVDADKIPRSNLMFETKSLPIKDVRGRMHEYSLDDQGFAFSTHSLSGNADLKDRAYVESSYIPLMGDFVKEFIEEPSARTFCFDIRVRQSIDPAIFNKRTINLEDGFEPLLPATHPHVDQSPEGARRRVLRHMGDDAESLLEKRVRILNIWRPLKKVEAWPLAICDTRSVDTTDLVPTDIVRRRYIGETCFGKYNPKQEWYYLSDQDVNEITILKIYDSKVEVNAKFCLHSSFPFSEPTRPNLRESIELRFLVFTDT